MRIEPNDQDLIKSAKRAWMGISGTHRLANWRVHPGSSYAVVATGTPWRARQAYTFAFVFQHRWNKGKNVWFLSGIAKAPWHKRISWRNGRFTDRSKVVRYFGPSDFIV